MEVESDSGEFVIRKGESEDGVYFVWKGEAEVCGDAEEKIGPEFQLKRYDYFGNGARTRTSEQQVDVIASSKLICLVLPPEHTALLWPKSIWSADERYENNAPLESILHLEPIEINLFQGNTSPDVFGVFGGQFIGQALAAASKTVDCLKTVHHLQAYFLLVGDSNIPIGYEVHHLQDGKSFSRRRVDALQNGNIVFTLLASFQPHYNSCQGEGCIRADLPDSTLVGSVLCGAERKKGLEHQEAVMPLVPPPDMLLSSEELLERLIIDPRLPRLSYWFRAKGKLSDGQALHRCLVAYASDLLFDVASYPHRKRGLKISVLSLNHTVWFHRTVNADDWLLFVIKSPSAHGARGLCTGQLFNRQGELIVSLIQEGSLREAKMPQSAIRAKY